MIRLVFPLAVVLALACGGESDNVGEAMEEGMGDVAAPAVSAAETAAVAAEDAAEAAETAEMEEVVRDDGVAESCIWLVAENKFNEALPVCTEALGLEPANHEVQQALEKAKSETASAAALGAAAADDPAAAAGKLLR